MRWLKPQQRNPYIEYVQQQLEKGYDIYAIRNFLIQKGYPQQEVDNAIDVLYRTPQQQTPSDTIRQFSIRTWVPMILIIAVCSIGIVGYWAYHTGIPPEQVLDDKNPNVERPFTAGKTVSFKHENAPPMCDDQIKNQGESGIDCGGPCAACETCFDGILNQNEEGIDCGGICDKSCEASISPSCFDGLKNQGERGIDCGGTCRSCPENEQTSIRETDILYEALALAKTDTENALQKCLTIKESALKEQCLVRLAKDADNYLYCARIDDPATQDTCYMHFVVTRKEYDVCNQLNNEYVQNSCEALKRAERIHQQYVQESMSSIQNATPQAT